MDWKDVGQTVAKVAPVLGTVLGGPVGAIAGAAGSLIASFFSVESTPEAVAAAMTPENMLKLKELELQHEKRLLEWQGQQLAADLENVKSARAREVDMAKAGTGFSSWGPPAMISFIVTVGFFVLLGMVVEDTDKKLGESAVYLLGVLGASFGAVVNYYLGSSLGSSQKTSALAQSMPARVVDTSQGLPWLKDGQRGGSAS